MRKFAALFILSAATFALAGMPANAVPSQCAKVCQLSGPPVTMDDIADDPGLIPGNSEDPVLPGPDVPTDDVVINNPDPDPIAPPDDPNTPPLPRPTM